MSIAQQRATKREARERLSGAAARDAHRRDGSSKVGSSVAMPARSTSVVRSVWFSAAAGSAAAGS